MDLKTYFDNIQGHGVLATADASGKVNAAVYSRPYVVDEKTVIFIMAERLTHENLKSNPHAAYLFIEAKEGYSGKRLYLTKTKEEVNPERAQQICKRCKYTFFNESSTRFLVYFNVDTVLPLIGAGS